MSLRAMLEARARRLALELLDDAAPGAGEFVRAFEAWQTQRAPIEVSTGASSSSTPGTGESEIPEGDTIAVEITDERGRVVGYTTATVKR